MEKETELYLIKRIKELEEELKSSKELNKNLVLKNCKLEHDNANVEAEKERFNDICDELVDFIIDTARLKRLVSGGMFHFLETSFNAVELPAVVFDEYKQREGRENETKAVGESD